MNHKLNVGFITTVSGRWPRELPNERLITYHTWLTQNFPSVNLCSMDTIIDSPERIREAITTFRQRGVDLVIMLYGAFTGDDVCTEIADHLKVPMILWAPREPELHGGRLLANGMVALTMNSASMHRLSHVCHPIYGGLESEDAKSRLISIVTAYDTIFKLKQTLIGLFGYRPTAFYNSAFDEGLIRRTFGIRIEETDLKVVYDKMASFPSALVSEDRKKVQNDFNCLTLPDEYYENHSRLYLALKELTKEQKYDYSAIKCWPEMGNLKTTPCAVLGRLAEEDIAIACEGDMDATLALITQNYITHTPNFITDMIDLNEEENYLTFWHCGNAAPSLHNKQFDGKMGDHPLAGQGTAFYTTLKEGPVTISRFCNINGTYKLFLLKGTARQTDLYTPGCMINVTVDAPVKDILYGMIDQGVPHHYSIVWQDVSETMKMIAKILGIDVITFS